MATLSIEPNERVTFGIIYEDESLVVVEKPARRVTLPGRGRQRDTLLNGLFARWGPTLQNIGRDRDFGLLHRLDRDTSGLVVVALTSSAYDKLREQFRARDVAKFYWAICAKAPSTSSGVIKLAMAESRLGEAADVARAAPKTAHVRKGGKPAATAYRVLQANELGAIVEARPITGRLHQVRVHLDAIGSPILGDRFYGPKRTQEAAARLMLHAHRLKLTHPVSAEPLDVRTGCPKDIKRVARLLELESPDATPSRG